ncbi:tol-pal system-associated acyl-CoA thioesterase [Oceanibium sediminis]|uniref:tol-pal system-associated acyl-CoA thioesterase n=1 Tax=Oceanibium sediminis TaxID=2026339 RepID=UPI000DD327CB|nr:tol-pal system-associated acyl-CoA thioesterase [Oceanibium sediminis]
MSFESRFRVYYEDTDMAGIVYYANYLKFMERGRSDAVREMGIDQGAMREAGLAFAVAHLSIDFHAPARFDDMLSVHTDILRTGGATLEMAQQIRVQERRIVTAQVRIACMTLDGRVARIPAAIRAQFGAAGAAPATR